jgi:lipoyl(octanoyl) transferase
VDVVAYIRQLEAVLIQAIARFGVIAERLKGYTGVWTWHNNELRKIAAIGVKINVDHITYHGFALNVNTDLSYFQGIIPCGISDKPVTSLQAILGQPVDMAVVIEAIIAAFGMVFERSMQPTDAAALLSL